MPEPSIQRHRGGGGACDNCGREVLDRALILGGRGQWRLCEPCTDLLWNGDEKLAIKVFGKRPHDAQG
ncbi:MAG: hypothetical protein ACREN2_06050 [Candidatus Dormibacteria bacterium]